MKKVFLITSLCLFLGFPIGSPDSKAADHCCVCDCMYLGMGGYHCVWTGGLGLTECVLFEFSPGVIACRWGDYCFPPPK